MDTELIAQIRTTVESLELGISVLNSDGGCLIPDVDIVYTLPGILEPGHVTEYQGRLFLKTTDELILMFTGDSSPAARDAMKLADRYIAALCAAPQKDNGRKNALLRVLQQDFSFDEAYDTARELSISEKGKYCVFVYYFTHVGEHDVQKTINEYVPYAPGDLITGIDRHTAVLVRDCSETDEYDELIQFSRAVQETIESETGIRPVIGLGDIVNGVGSIHESYRQARRAIEIGRVFNADNDLYIYRTMLLERFLSDLSEESALHYHSLLFNPDTDRLFSDEMLQTIDMFFCKDLNLSDTARQLYIHRNTLVYRLDKVQRTVGLDLRKFDDAVTFKILRDMKKRSGYKPKEK